MVWIFDSPEPAIVPPVAIIVSLGSSCAYSDVNAVNILKDIVTNNFLKIFFIVFKFIELIDCSYNTNCININPVVIATIVATRPGIIKLWLSKYFPILVVPVLSKLIAATIVG